MNLPLTSLQRSATLEANYLTKSAYPYAKSPSRQACTDITEPFYLGYSHMVLAENGRVLYISENLKTTAPQLEPLARKSGVKRDTSIGPEFAFICQVLRESRSHFADQNWTLHCNIFTKAGTMLSVHARWLKPDQTDPARILLAIEDAQQMAQDILLDEVRHWGLTPREQEVCLLHHEGCTYNQIAERLCITLNTVKKHMRSIYAKRRAVNTD